MLVQTGAALTEGTVRATTVETVEYANFAMQLERNKEGTSFLKKGRNVAKLRFSQSPFHCFHLMARINQNMEQKTIFH